MQAHNQDATISLFTALLKQLVDGPDRVHIATELEANGGVCVRVLAPAADIGKVIGRNGRTARALRVLLSAVGSAQKTSYTLDIVEAPGP